jgi:hypothetical protein
MKDMPSKRDLRGLELRQKRARERRNRLLIIGAVVVGVVALIALVVMQSGVLSPAPTVALASTGTCGSVQSFPSLGQDHINPGDPHPPYNSNPPTSGWHWPAPQNWGIYSQPQVQEQILHNLEHGGVNIQYKDLNGPEVQRLVNLVHADPYKLILAPYPGLPSDVKIALTVWNGPNGITAQQVGRVLYCTGVDENAIRAFINAYRDKAPEQVM